MCIRDRVLMAPSAIAVVLAALGYKGFSTFLSNRGMQLLGRLSFPVYLLHWPLLLGLVPRFRYIFLSQGIDSRYVYALVTVVYITLTLLSAMAFEALIDARSIRLGKFIRSQITV